jgi:hypothetical protein
MLLTQNWGSHYIAEIETTVDAFLVGELLGETERNRWWARSPREGFHDWHGG